MKKFIIGKKDGVIVGKHKITNKALLTGIGLFLVIVVVVNIVSNMYLNSTTVQRVAESTYGYKAKQFIDNPETDYVLIGLYADSKQEGLDKLKTMYYKLSDKKPTKDVQYLDVVIYDSYGKVLFNSDVTADTITTTDWNGSYSYDEFITLANVQ